MRPVTICTSYNLLTCQVPAKISAQNVVLIDPEELKRFCVETAIHNGLWRNNTDGQFGFPIHTDEDTQIKKWVVIDSIFDVKTASFQPRGGSPPEGWQHVSAADILVGWLKAWLDVMRAAGSLPTDDTELIIQMSAAIQENAPWPKLFAATKCENPDDECEISVYLPDESCLFLTPHGPTTTRPGQYSDRSNVTHSPLTLENWASMPHLGSA